MNAISNGAIALHFEVGAKLAAAIIEERTNALAEQNKPGLLRASAMPFCMFRVGGERFALEIGAIEAVIKARPLGALPVEYATLLGSLFERGEIWIVYSLRALMGGAPETDFSKGYLLLLLGDGRRSAIFVDHVEEIASLPSALFSSASDREPAADSLLVRGTAPDGRMLLCSAAIQSALSRSQRSNS
ncbi:MAG: chemotaxis protein CheW [Parvularculaceae bacterium]